MYPHWTRKCERRGQKDREKTLKKTVLSVEAATGVMTTLYPERGTERKRREENMIVSNLSNLLKQRVL